METTIQSDTVAQAEIKAGWLLIAYDIPAKDGKVRYQFLKEAGKIGAMYFTDSVYLLPDGVDALKMAAGLSQVGKCYIWKSTPTNKAQHQEMLTAYEKYVKLKVDVISLRLKVAKDHIEAGEKSLATKMAATTMDKFNDLKTLMVNYHETWLKTEFTNLAVQFKEVYGGK